MVNFGQVVSPFSKVFDFSCILLRNAIYCWGFVSFVKDIVDIEKKLQSEKKVRDEEGRRKSGRLSVFYM